MGSRELKKAATRQALVDAAARLFAERGVDGTTMDDIARAAGTSRTSVFNYFGYKEMILCEIGARHVAEIMGSTRIGEDGRRSPRRRLTDITDALAQIADRDPVIVAAIARELTHPDPGRRRQASETMGYARMVDATMDALAATGRLLDGRMRDSHARMMVDMVAGILVRAGGDFPMSHLRAELRRAVDLFLRGILRDPDRS